MTELAQRSDADRGLLRETIRRFARQQVSPYVSRLDTEGEFVWELVELYRQQGFYGAIVPEEYGGQAGSLTDVCIILEELAWVDATAAIYLCTPLSSGVLYLMHAGNEDQKRRFLPPLAAGSLAAMALTESGAGSDAGAISTQAKRDGDRYVIHGEKIFVSMGNVADYIVIFARTGPGEGNRGLSAFITPANTPGIVVGRSEHKMGFHGKPTVGLLLEDVAVSAEDRLGAEGDGFKVAMGMFNESRVLIGALSVGLGQGALDDAVQYTKQRVQFGRPVAANQGLQFMMAEMFTKIEAARALVYHAATQVEREAPNMRSMAAMAKYFCSDVAMSVTTDAVQLFGGAGYIRESGVEKRMRDAKLLQIFEGTNQIQRLIIARDLVGRF